MKLSLVLLTMTACYLLWCVYALERNLDTVMMLQVAMAKDLVAGGVLR